jgi:hypothetical protein
MSDESRRVYYEEIKREPKRILDMSFRDVLHSGEDFITVI